MEFSAVLRWVIIAGSIAMNNGLCPSSCTCSTSKHVICTNVTSFPSRFPEDSSKITIKNLNVDEIPPGLFDDLFELEAIEIISGTIRRISTGAFSNLMYLDMISISDVSIGTINSGAFSNISDVGDVVIKHSTIDKIDTEAFSQLFALDEIKISTSSIGEISHRAFTSIDELFELTFYSNYVKELKPYAFMNMSNVYRLSVYQNRFDNLGCGGMESLLDQTEEHEFYSNAVSCSCDILWIQNNPSFADHYFSNWCETTETKENIFWGNLSPETVKCDENVIHRCPPASAFENNDILNDSKIDADEEEPRREDKTNADESTETKIPTYTTATIPVSKFPSTSARFATKTTVEVKRIPTKQNSDVHLERDSGENNKDIDITIADTHERKTDGKDASSYNKDSHDVAFVSDKQNSSSRNCLNFVLLVSALLTICLS